MTKLTTINGKLRRYTGSSGYNLVFAENDYVGCCCSKACLCYGSSSIWGDGGLEITSSTNLADLCLIVAGTINTCGNDFPSVSVFPAAAIQAWVTSGGILAIKTEYPPTCGDIPAMNAYLSSIGSNMTVGSERIACGSDSDPPGYIGTLAALPVTAGMGATINSGGAAAAISGGTAIVTAPACPGSFSGGVSLAGEQKGAGVIFLASDSNLDGFTQLIINNAVNIKQNGGNYF